MPAVLSKHTYLRAPCRALILVAWALALCFTNLADTSSFLIKLSLSLSLSLYVRHGQMYDLAERKDRNKPISVQTHSTRKRANLEIRLFLLFGTGRTNSVLWENAIRHNWHKRENAKLAQRESSKSTTFSLCHLGPEFRASRNVYGSFWRKSILLYK